MQADNINTIAFLLDNLNVGNGIVASVTQSQGNGVIPYGFSRVTTVANDRDAITLPPAKKDAFVSLLNDDTVNRIELWPESGDQIDDEAIDASIFISTKQRIALVGIGSQRWFSIIKSNSVAEAITAFAGGGQASATLLFAEWNRVSIVGSNGDSVKLPDAKAGTLRAVYNDDSLQSVDVFPNTNDRINDLANDTAISLGANSSIVFRCMSSGLWNTYGKVLNGVTIGIVATGTTQGAAKQLYSAWNQISTSTATNNAVKLPNVVIGHECFIHNDDNADAVQVFPTSGQQIDDLGTDAAYSLAVDGRLTLRGISSTKWLSE